VCVTVIIIVSTTWERFICSVI